MKKAFLLLFLLSFTFVSKADWLYVPDHIIDQGCNKAFIDTHMTLGNDYFNEYIDDLNVLLKSAKKNPTSYNKRIKPLKNLELIKEALVYERYTALEEVRWIDWGEKTNFSVFTKEQLNILQSVEGKSKEDINKIRDQLHSEHSNDWDWQALGNYFRYFQSMDFRNSYRAKVELIDITIKHLFGEEFFNKISLKQGDLKTIYTGIDGDSEEPTLPTEVTGPGSNMLSIHVEVIEESYDTGKLSKRPILHLRNAVGAETVNFIYKNNPKIF